MQPAGKTGAKGRKVRLSVLLTKLRTIVLLANNIMVKICENRTILLVSTFRAWSHLSHLTDYYPGFAYSDFSTYVGRPSIAVAVD